MAISLFNQKEKFNRPNNSNPATPAEMAEAVWDRRVGAVTVQAYNWRRIAIGLIVVVIVLSVGLVMQSLKSQVIPYVVTVDKSTGNVEKAGAFINSDYTPQEAEIKYFLAEFIKNARSVGYDPVIWDNQQRLVKSYLTQTAAMAYDARFRDLNKRVGKQTVSIKNLSVQKVPESDSTYLVRWVEEVVDINSSHYEDIPMSGTFSYTMLPVKEENIMTNPLGMYITGFDFAKDAAAINTSGQQAIAPASKK